MSNRRGRGKSRQQGSNKPKTPATRSQIQGHHSAVGDQRGRSEVTFSAYFEGPMPPPDMLARYDEIVPGFAETLLGEFTQQGSHRRGLEATVITANVRAQDRGQWIGAALFFAMIASATILGVSGEPGAALGVTAMAGTGFGGVYLWGRRHQERERTE